MKQRIYDFINSRIGAGLCSPLIREPIKSGALKIHTGTSRVETLQQLQIRLGRYERYERMLVRKYFHDNLNTLDLGASLGVIACEILGHLKTGKLISVEADPELCEIARTNISFNFPLSDAEVINAAVTSEMDATSSIQFGRPLSGNLGGHVLGTLSGHTDVISVPTVTLPKIVEKFGNESFQLSCDIEGSEIPLFLHSKDAFRRCELMMVELHNSSYNGESYTPQQVAAIIERNLAMKKRHQRDNVYLFVRMP